jgi:hypothetical protein
MEREEIDFTDRELYYVAHIFRSYLEGDNWISKGGAKIINSILNKIIENGMKRKDPKSILHPIKEFNN